MISLHLDDLWRWLAYALAILATVVACDHHRHLTAANERAGEAQALTREAHRVTRDVVAHCGADVSRAKNTVAEVMGLWRAP